MKSRFTTFNKFNNNFYRKLGTQYGRFRTRKKFSQIAPMYKAKPQVMGSGTTVRYITTDYTINTSAVKLNIGDQLYNDDEVQNYMQRYNYMKIASVKVKITPTNETGKIYILGEWNAKESGITSADITNNDSTKIIATHNIKYQTRTWLPPDMNASIVDKTTTSEKISTINLKKYNRTDDYYYSKGTQQATYSILYPLTLAMKATISMEVSIIVKVIFRGEKFSTTLNALYKLYKDDDGIKEKVKQYQERHKITKKPEKKEEFEEEVNEIKDDEQEEKEEEVQVGKEKEINDIINKIKNL